jgi:hypothetical protein
MEKSHFVFLRIFGKNQLKKKIHPYILKISKCLQQNLKFKSIGAPCVSYFSAAIEPRELKFSA